MNELDYQMAPCLKDGPLAKAGERLIITARSLSESITASVLKSWCVAVSFKRMQEAFDQKGDPTSKIINCLHNLTEFLEMSRESKVNRLGLKQQRQKWEFLHATAEHYGELFKAFDHRSFRDEPVKLLSQRLRRNGFDPAEVAERKLVLDAGCGGGRYAVAWQALGAKFVMGVDFAWKGIHDAMARVEGSGLAGLRFIQGDVLNLPFKDNAFDVVFSNGVLHHTVDWRKGIAEAVRVVKPGGFGWLYLIESPGGLFWDVIEILRVLMKGVNLDLARNALYLVGVPPNKVFYMLDHVMVPVNIRLRPAEIEECLRRVGAIDIQRLGRGTEFDRIERIYQGEPYATIKYGVGENRYVFTKSG